MESLPTVQELLARAAAGHVFTLAEVRHLREAEMAVTGAPGPIPNGPAATIEAIYDAQQRLAAEVSSCVTPKYFQELH